MEQEKWRGRITYRSDLVARLTHLTGKHVDSDDDAYDLLWKILTDKVLIASGSQGYIIGETKAVCFQEVPLTALAENLLYENQLGRKSYSWFGLRVNKGWLFQQGGLPVIYGPKNELKGTLHQNDYWRIVNMNLEKPDEIIDWSHEREWRHPDDLQFQWEDIEIILKSHKYYRKFVEQCISDNQTDMLKSIRGIIILDSVLS